MIVRRSKCKVRKPVTVAQRRGGAVAAERRPTPTSAELDETIALLRARLRRIGRLGRRGATLSSRTEEEWDGLVGDLAELLDRFDATPVAPAAVYLLDRTRLRTRDAGEERRTLEAIAFEGVAALDIERHGVDWARVRIGTHEPLTLARSLVNLLAVLADDAPSADHLVGWKTFEEVAVCLCKLEGQPVSRHALINRICRLRKALRAAKINPHYVLVLRHKGARFALRRVGGRAEGSA